MPALRNSIYSLVDLTLGNYAIPKEGEVIFSVLKQRLWRRHILFLARLAEYGKLVMYDQDPREAYHDKASSTWCKRTCVNSATNRILSYLWLVANYIREVDSIPVKFVRMGVQVHNCKLGKSFEHRKALLSKAVFINTDEIISIL